MGTKASALFKIMWREAGPKELEFNKAMLIRLQ